MGVRVIRHRVIARSKRPIISLSSTKRMLFGSDGYTETKIYFILVAKNYTKYDINYRKRPENLTQGFQIFREKLGMSVRYIFLSVGG